MNVLVEYEKVAGQLINLSKSFLYIHEKVPLAVKNRIRRFKGIAIGSFPFTYLRYPIYYGKRKKSYFEDLIQKVKRRILVWHSRFLTYGGRYILIKSVLESLPIYLMSSMNPPKGVNDQIHNLIAKFFWSKIGG